MEIDHIIVRVDLCWLELPRTYTPVIVWRYFWRRLVEKGRLTLNARSTIPRAGAIDLIKGRGEKAIWVAGSISLCFLTTDAMWRATSFSCCSNFPVLWELYLKSWVKVDISLSCFSQLFGHSSQKSRNFLVSRAQVSCSDCLIMWFVELVQVIWKSFKMEARGTLA